MRKRGRMEKQRRKTNTFNFFLLRSASGGKREKRTEKERREKDEKNDEIEMELGESNDRSRDGDRKNKGWRK